MKKARKVKSMKTRKEKSETVGIWHNLFSKCAEKPRYPCADGTSYTTHKTQLKMDERLINKTQNHKTHKRKHKGKSPWH